MHTYLYGPMKKQSIGGSFYFLTFIMILAQKIQVYIVKRKLKTLDNFKEFKDMEKNRVESTSRY